jgi:dihydrolipoamide dehydrogenase
VAVIGSGPGGYVAAIQCAKLGLKTACIEKSSLPGGTCLHVGCIPSKTLLQSTEYLSWLQQDSKEHGIAVSEANLDWEALQQRKHHIIQGLSNGVSSLFKANGVVSIQGEASFLSAHELEIKSVSEKKTLTANSFIIATGSEPIALPFLPFDEEKIVSSTGALQLKSIPKKMIVIGGGVIGVELASVYNRLGTEIIIIEMLPEICVSMDASIRKALLQSLKKQGLSFYLDSKVLSGKIKENHVVLKVHQAGREMEVEGDVVLTAIGRKPFTAGLNLDALGIQTEKGFILVDGHFRTHIPHIYAIGDVIPGPMLAHKASEEGIVVAECIAGREAQLNYLAIPNVIYTHPEAASLGLTEQEAKASGLEISVGTAYFKFNPRARCLGFTEGFVKVIGAGKEKILVGMHMIGPQVSELINTGVMAIESKMTLHDIANAPTAHPTLSETIKEAAMEGRR